MRYGNKYIMDYMYWVICWTEYITNFILYTPISMISSTIRQKT